MSTENQSISTSLWGSESSGMDWFRHWLRSPAPLKTNKVKKKVLSTKCIKPLPSAQDDMNAAQHKIVSLLKTLRDTKKRKKEKNIVT